MRRRLDPPQTAVVAHPVRRDPRGRGSRNCLRQVNPLKSNGWAFGQTAQSGAYRSIRPEVWTVMTADRSAAFRTSSTGPELRFLV